MVEYIERGKLIEKLKKDPLFELVERYGITGVIESIPAADVRPVVRGKWSVLCEYVSISENRRRKTNVKTWMCSNCLASNGRRKTNYCPNCGADMREKADV